MSKSTHISGNPLGVLTKSEYAAAELLLKGCTRQEIATERGISVSGVNFHIKNIYTKTGCKTVNEFLIKHGSLIHNEK